MHANNNENFKKYKYNKLPNKKTKTLRFFLGKKIEILFKSSFFSSNINYMETQNAGTTPSCTMKSCYCSDRWVEPASGAKPPAASTCAVVQKKFDGAAAWILSGFTAAFFSSLERCSCINIATKDDLDDDSPLIPVDDVVSSADDVRFSADDLGAEEGRDRTVEGKKYVIHVK